MTAYTDYLRAEELHSLQHPVSGTEGELSFLVVCQVQELYFALTAFDTHGDDVPELVVRIGKALVATPDFLRLGLMLTLERRPQEASARRMFLQVRQTTLERIVSTVREFAPDLGDDAVRLLALYAMAAVDGFFVAHEIGGDSVDLGALFALHGKVLVDAARHLGLDKL